MGRFQLKGRLITLHMRGARKQLASLSVCSVWIAVQLTLVHTTSPIALTPCCLLSSQAYSTGTAPLHSPEDFPQQPTQITQQQNSRGSETAKKKKSKFKALIGKFRRVLGVSEHVVQLVKHCTWMAWRTFSLHPSYARSCTNVLSFSPST